MWSLPDIQRLNFEAHLNRKKLERAAETGCLDRKRLRCEYGRNCEGQLSYELWFDIFSDDPKGIITQCEYHRRRGIPDGFFWCPDCNRLMIENYTWEIYRTMNNHGEQLCLRCAADLYIEDENNWIALRDEDIAVVTFELIRRARHVLAVGMPVPQQIQLLGKITLDSSTGGLIRSFEHSDATPAAGAAEMRRLLNEAKEAGHTRALLIVDGAYQFAVSIGVYVPPSPRTAGLSGRSSKAAQ